jgi:hypothetical protein
MRRVVTCHCGAVYERTESRLVFWVMDDFLCRECGEVLESWNGSRVPVYALIQREDGSVTGLNDSFPRQFEAAALHDALSEA